ncbi:MAG: hypothetical protein IJO97_03290 [Lachnospiraceae bacterium]|nr:hypothetical protein [Lachnospiraceae bacterium]
MNQSRILPFYMAYPLPMYYQEEDSVTRDLEYLQQMYPMEAKRYQKIIVDTLNQMDYEGSMIYDEYPDKWQLYRLTQIIIDKIKRMESNETNMPNEMLGNMSTNNAENASGRNMERQWEHLEEFIQVLLYYEIYKKRHANHRGILKF